jgi:RNA methyltransferase, TrmH family
VKTIRSRENAYVKQLIALAHSSRERKKAGLTVLDGIHLVRAYVEAVEAPHSMAVAEAAVGSAEVQSLLTLLSQMHAITPLNVLTDSLIAEASSLDSPSAVLALVSTPVPQEIAPDATAVLVLEDLQDPGNVGSMLRTAAAAGVREVVLSKSTAFAWSPKVLRAAQGAHFALNIVEGVDVVAFVENFSGQSIALVPRLASSTSAAEFDAGHEAQPRSLYDCDLRRPTALLIGNEGAGLSPALIKAATLQANIPMPGQVESLNAAACAAIALFEMVRQRN